MKREFDALNCETSRSVLQTYQSRKQAVAIQRPSSSSTSQHIKSAPITGLVRRGTRNQKRRLRLPQDYAVALPPAGKLTPSRKNSPADRTSSPVLWLGLSNREISDRPGLSEGTAGVHLHRIYQSMSATNRTQSAMQPIGRIIFSTAVFRR